ncbi:MAG: acyl-CoA dehydrogenase family protein [Rhodospirillales bacterium]
MTSPKTGHTDDLAKVLERFSEVATTTVKEDAEATDREARWPERGIQELLTAGLAGLVVPQRYGGLGHGLLALARACETVGQECASTAICFGMHCVGSSVIAARATPHQTATYLRPISEGRHLTTLALSEPGTGAHFYYPHTRLSTAGDDDLIIDGEKTFVTNGTHADSYVVSVMREDERELAQFSCVIVDKNLDGMSWGSQWQGFGMRGNDSRGLKLDSVRISRDNLLGSEGDQIWYVFNVVAPYFLMAMSGVYLGVASTALALARDHLLNREHSHTNTRLGDSTVLQNCYAVLWSKLESTRRLVFDAASRFDQGDPDAVISVLASKAEVADVATETVNNVMTLMGGLAYRDGSQVQRLLRDVRAAHVMAPTTELLRTWVGRMLLGKPPLGS